jgi:hypothetical protein
MAFKSVCGFDPDEPASTSPESTGEADVFDCAYTLVEQQSAHIPPDRAAQIYELRRMFRS